MPEAIDAALGLRPGDKIHHHQRRIGRNVLSQARRRLKQVANEIDTAKDFEALHKIIGDETQEICRFGDLAVYDVAYRLGRYRNLHPGYVYLHAGTRDGAKAFGATGDKVRKTFFPQPLQALSAGQIEDFLCIFKDQLHGRSAISSHPWCGTVNSPKCNGPPKKPKMVC